MVKTTGGVQIMPPKTSIDKQGGGSKTSFFVLNKGRDTNAENFIGEMMLVCFFENENLQPHYKYEPFFKEGEMGFATIITYKNEYQVFSHKAEGMLIIDKIGGFYYSIISSNEPFNALSNISLQCAKADNEYCENNPGDPWACDSLLPGKYPEFKSITYLIGARRDYRMPFLVKPRSQADLFLDGENPDFLRDLESIVVKPFEQYQEVSPHYSTIGNHGELGEGRPLPRKYPNFELPKKLQEIKLTGINCIVDDNH